MSSGGPQPREIGFVSHLSKLSKSYPKSLFRKDLVAICLRRIGFVSHVFALGHPGLPAGQAELGLFRTHGPTRREATLLARPARDENPGKMGKLSPPEIGFVLHDSLSAAARNLLFSLRGLHTPGGSNLLSLLLPWRSGGHGEERNVGQKAWYAIFLRVSLSWPILPTRAVRLVIYHSLCHN